MEDVCTQPEERNKEPESVIEIQATEFSKNVAKARAKRASVSSAANPEPGNNISLVTDLKSKSAKLKDLGRDPLPEAILVAKNVSQEQTCSKKRRVDAVETVAAKDPEIGGSSVVLFKETEGADKSRSGKQRKLPNLTRRGNLMEAQENARTLSVSPCHSQHGVIVQYLLFVFRIPAFLSVHFWLMHLVSVGVTNWSR